MKVIPAISVKGSEVVRVLGSDRSKYEVLESDLCPTGEPLPFAYAMAERFKCAEIYVADLDAIAGSAPNFPLIGELIELGMTPWVDAGVRDVADAMRIRQAGAAVVVGSETLNGFDAWERIVQAIDSRRLAFSMDLDSGRIIAPHFNCDGPEQLIEQLQNVAEQVRADGPTRWLVIDVAHAGTREGIGNQSLLRNLVDSYPQFNFYAGGGVRGPKEVKRLTELGLAGVLASTAIHAGKLHPGDQSKTAH